MFIDEHTGKIWRVVSVTPVGRPQFGPLLIPYLEGARPILDEHHWWFNTADPALIAWYSKVSEKHPDFYHCICHPSRSQGFSHHTLAPFYPLACEPNTIYIRIDEDVVWMAPDAIRELVWFRLKHPTPILVFANTVNSPLCTHLHERMKAVTLPTHVGYNFLDPCGHADGAVASLIHRAFIEAVENGLTDRFKINSWWLWSFEPNHLHCVAWLGSDMLAAVPLPPDDVKFLTQDLPIKMNRTNVISGTSLVSHFLYDDQHVGDEEHESLMESYRSLVPGSEGT
jgi:hypothetical protein